MNSRPESLKRDWCSYDAARFAVEHWHYSGMMPRGKNARLGVWEDGKYIGALVFGMGVGTAGRACGLGPFEATELMRIALKAHKAPVSRIVAIGARLLKRAMPGLRLLVSYADPARGHHGGIYQAAGWIYVGVTEPTYYVVDRAGRRWHERCCSPSGFKRHFGKLTRAMRPQDGAGKVTLPGKHRYFLPLDAEVRDRAERLRKPYPRRSASIESDATADQAREDGASPIAELQ
jgi:hypothetical protein